jgi:TatD family-associated radical SAM protein
MNNIFTYRIGDSLYINLTNACPCACVFCIRENGGIGYDLWLEREPTADEVCKQIEDARAWCKEIVFCGYGEPTQKLAELLEIARFSRNSGLKVRLNTNGLGNLINGRDITAELADVLDVASVSLNAPNKKRYNELCKSVYGEAAYGAMLEFTRTIVSRGTCVIMSVVDALTADETAACEAIAKSLGAGFRVRAL